MSKSHTVPKSARPSGARKPSSGALSTPGVALVEHGRVKSFDGTQIFYSQEGKGQPLVFCYGLVCSSLHWTYQIQHFQESYQAIWFDYRGHHHSETPKDLSSLTVESSARDLLAVLDEMGVQKAVLLGHSMGVNIVLEFYKRNPDRVAAMVLANGTAKSPLETLFHHNASQLGFQALKKLNRTVPELLQMVWRAQKSNPIARSIVTLGGFNPHLTPQADIDLYYDQVVAMDPRILLTLMESYEDYDATSWLHSVKVPTLVLAGEMDKIIPIEQQELMHQLIPGSEFEVIRHGSHCPQMDLPDLVNQRIERFLRGVKWG